MDNSESNPSHVAHAAEFGQQLRERTASLRGTPRRLAAIAPRTGRRTRTQTSHGSDVPKRTDLQSILILGSGPVVIGKAAEFDYSGTQAVRALREEGYRVILVNNNPATITIQCLVD